MKAVAIPYVIALILGVIIIGLIGYWFISQGGKTVKAGTQAECDAVKFNYCKGAAWDTKCGDTPLNCCGNGAVDPARGEECEPGQKSGVCTDPEQGTPYERVCRTNCKWPC